MTYSHFNNNELLPHCALDDACFVSCNCDEGFYGNACQFTLQDQQKRQEIRNNLFNSSRNIQTLFVDADNNEQLKQMISLTNAIIKQIDEISNDFIADQSIQMLKSYLHKIITYSHDDDTLLLQIFDCLHYLLMSHSNYLYNKKSKNETFNESHVTQELLQLFEDFAR